jgi:excisionase family DNA binding protein
MTDTVTHTETERQTYSLREFADLMGISYPHTVNLVAENKIPGVIRLGRRVLISRVAVDQMLGKPAATVTQ